MLLLLQLNLFLFLLPFFVISLSFHPALNLLFPLIEFSIFPCIFISIICLAYHIPIINPLTNWRTHSLTQWWLTNVTLRSRMWCHVCPLFMPIVSLLPLLFCFSLKHVHIIFPIHNVLSFPFKSSYWCCYLNRSDELGLVHGRAVEEAVAGQVGRQITRHHRHPEIMGCLKKMERYAHLPLSLSLSWLIDWLIKTRFLSSNRH